jgi:hypothetical protein
VISSIVSLFRKPAAEPSRITVRFNRFAEEPLKYIAWVDDHAVYGPTEYAPTPARAAESLARRLGLLREGEAFADKYAALVSDMRRIVYVQAA